MASRKTPRHPDGGTPAATSFILPTSPDGDRQRFAAFQRAGDHESAKALFRAHLDVHRENGKPVFHHPWLKEDVPQAWKPILYRVWGNAAIKAATDQTANISPRRTRKPFDAGRFKANVEKSYEALRDALADAIYPSFREGTFCHLEGNQKLFQQLHDALHDAPNTEISKASRITSVSITVPEGFNRADFVNRFSTLCGIGLNDGDGELEIHHTALSRLSASLPRREEPSRF